MSRSRTIRPGSAGPPRRGASLAGGALLLALLAGCTGASNGEASGSSGAASSAGGEADSGAGGGASTTAGGAVRGEVKSGAKPAGLLTLTDGRELIRTAQISIKVTDVGAAVDEAEAMAVAAGGLVAEESIRAAGTADPADATVTMRVPPARFGGILDDLAALGTVTHGSQQTQDVTAQVIDVRSRLTSQRSALARLRALLDRAQSLGDVVKLESELSRREADLESLQARQRVLSAQTQLATIQARFAAGDTVAPPQRARLGFLAGLENGWQAFTGAFAVALTVLGALVPWAVLAVVALVVGQLARSTLRSLRPTRRVAPPPAP